MIRNTLRILLVAVLAVLLPLQGAAAVATAQCVALDQHDAVSGAGPTHAHDGHDGHDHAPASNSDGGSPPHHCGPCAACCASASIAEPMRLLVAASPDRVASVSPDAPPPGILPRTLDRPPLAL